MAKGRFGGADFQPHHLGAEPASPVGSAPDSSAAPEPPVGTPRATRAPAPKESRAPSKSMRVSFSSRVSPEALQQIQEYAHQKKLSQADVLAEALNLFFRAKKLEEVA